MGKTMLFLAPHFEYPPRNGGDLYVERIACHVSSQRDEVLLLGAGELLQYKQGRLAGRSAYANSRRSKVSAALRVIVYRSHYYLEKFLTPDYCAQAARLIASHPQKKLVCSYIVTATLAPDHGGQTSTIILTHNEEFAWFGNQYRFSANPVQKLVARLSEKWLGDFLRLHGRNYLFAHITEADRNGYETHLPGHTSIILPAGVDVDDLPPLPDEPGIIKLIFSGSLSVTMNYDALAFFKERFWGPLQNAFPGQIEMVVAGSHPTARVHNLCHRQGWSLLPDLPDVEFRAVLGKSHFSILPFPYTTGAKIKLLASLSVGVPVMATTNMNSLPGLDFMPNLYSDDPQVWVRHLNLHARDSVCRETRSRCRAYASGYGWDIIAQKFHFDLQAYEHME